MEEGLVMASDSRSNAGYDQVNVCRKMHRFVQEGERVFVICRAAASPSVNRSFTLLRNEFDAGQGLAKAESLYQAARIVGDWVRKVSDMDQAALERDDFKFQRAPAAGRQVTASRDPIHRSTAACIFGMKAPV
jgi:putative proteasome-type protease